MRYLKTSFMVVLVAFLVCPVKAEEKPAETEGGRPDRAEFRQKMLEEFDADGDGQLSDDERATAREEMRGRRGKAGAKGRHGGRGGAGPPNPEKLFERFDTNGDNQLSREEFHQLAESMREHHEKMRQGKGPRGKGPHGKGPRGESRGRRAGPPAGPDDQPGPQAEGPRAERRRDFGPLQNPGDRPEKSRRAGKGHRGRGPQGPGGRGLEGRRPPNPDQVFDRFDANDDGQLSREEFMELSQAMRKHHGRGPAGKRGAGHRRPSQSESNDGANLQSSSGGDDSV